VSPPTILPGAPEPLGLTLLPDGANIAVYSQTAERIELCLFDRRGKEETARLALPGRTGPVFHGFVPALREGALYGLRAHGPFRPEDGLRFNPNKLLIDPHALALDGPAKLHEAMLDLDSDSGPFAPRCVAAAPQVATPQRRKIPWSDTILYELHVRGFTRRLTSLPEAARGTFAGLAHPVAIAHLKLLGVTTLEIMPCAAWIDECHLRAAGLANYWGYNPIAFCAPEPRLAPGGWREVRESVAALQAAGFEVLIDVVLNHSGESDAGGPTLSLRGLDNATYYRLDPADPARTIDDAGCGNILRLDHPATLRLAMDALRAWAHFGGVDGFRFDLATTLGRRAEGFDPHAPLLAAIQQDPLLRDLKLIAEPWDIGPGGYQLGRFPALWGEWNDQFRDAARKFWRGDGGQIGALATRMAGSADLFAASKPPARGVNFITAHDGFTLADLVAYERKRNFANGENNRDGTESNHSWNNGAEGETDDEAILAARRRDQRNLLTLLLLSRGTPMLSMGAEFAQSQHGNNNAYAQDNETAWLDWDKADPRLAAFTRALIALRRATPAFTQDRFLAGAPQAGESIPDVEWRGADGEALRDGQWQESERRFLGAFFFAEGSRAGVLLNASHETALFRLPPTRANFLWRRTLDTSSEDGAGDGAAFDCGETLAVAPRSSLVLIEAPENDVRFETPPHAETLDALARAAGIAPDWHDLEGRRHIVPESTRHALLNAMGFATAMQSDARASLKRLPTERDRRALPFALVFHEGEAIEAPLAGPAPIDALILTGEDGAEQAVAPEPIRQEQRRACDGLPFSVQILRLPPLPLGRYRLALAGEPAAICHLTIAPRACFRPEALDSKLSGVSAQLYSLRRDGDQGIGDFTTLAELSEAAARAGYGAVGVNPLHALFARDRDRASPYYPSDRSFLDPIYLDVERLSEITGLPSPLDPQARALADALAAKPAIDYPAVWTLKRDALRAHFRAFVEASSDPSFAAARDCESFVAESGEALWRFAAFEAQARTGAAPSERDMAEICFEQWLCDRQLARAVARGKAAGLSLGLYRDLAVGAAPDGAEIAAGDGLFLKGVAVGAPPDPFAEAGQVWGLPAPDPLALVRDGYAAFASLLRANMRHAGALRIDHVMALQRLFVVPEGAPALEGAYLDYPLDDLLGELAVESHRAGCAVVGEDLGTVPNGFREKMAAAHVLSYRVLFFERIGENFAPPTAYPRKALACASTHDLPTLAGWRRGADIEEKAALGLIAAGAAEGERERRRADEQRLFAALAEEALLPAHADLKAIADSDFIAAVHAYVARTSSVLAMVQIDDLLGETSGVNLPGTDRERPNWRRRLARNADAFAPVLREP
jgi:glycogen debranching enzyme GlgX